MCQERPALFPRVDLSRVTNGNARRYTLTARPVITSEETPGLTGCIVNLGGTTTLTPTENHGFTWFLYRHLSTDMNGNRPRIRIHSHMD